MKSRNSDSFIGEDTSNNPSSESRYDLFDELFSDLILTPFHNQSNFSPLSHPNEQLV